MDILKKELERKRKQIAETNLVTDRKFFRRGDLEVIQREQYWKKYNDKHASNMPSTSTSLLQPYQSSEESAQQNDELHLQLSREDVIRKLRDRNAPIRLFGENDIESFKRLRSLEVDLPDVETGFRNDLQAAMEQVDEDFLKEIIAGQGTDDKHDAVVEDETITLRELQEKIQADLGKGNPDNDSELVHEFFNFVLQKWAREFNSRPSEEKRSSKGKFALATYTQTAEYLKPLFRKLKNKTCLPDIRDHLVNITMCLLKRDYIQANNCYMEMAIGNAPWPVGVTASGIHKRPGSEKLYVRNVAHVLNDETQRKYIQGIKRLMTRCQVYFVADPSKCVEYKGIGYD